MRGKRPQSVKKDGGQKKPERPGAKKLTPEQGFKEALRRMRRGDKVADWPALVGLLSPYAEENPDQLTAQKLLGLALLETGAAKEAAHCFQTAFSSSKNDIEVLNGLAYFEILNGRTDAAVNYLLDALYIHDNHLRLKSNLEKIRNMKDPKIFAARNRPSDFIFVELPAQSFGDGLGSALSDLLRRPFMRPLAFIAAAVVAVVLLVTFFPAIKGAFEDLTFSNSISKEKMTRVNIKDIDKILAERTSYNLRLSPDDIRRKFEMIKMMMEQKKINRAIILVNELLNSNASDLIKERVMMLSDLIQDITAPEGIDFTPQIQDVIKLPFIYKGVFIQWDGTVANLEHRARRQTSFDLLINFVDNATVDGIADTVFDGFQEVRNGGKAKIFGRIMGITDENKIMLKGLQWNPIDR